VTRPAPGRPTTARGVVVPTLDPTGSPALELVQSFVYDGNAGAALVNTTLEVADVNASRWQLCSAAAQPTCVSLADSTVTSTSTLASLTLSPATRGLLAQAGLPGSAGSMRLLLDEDAITFAGGLEVPEMMVAVSRVIADTTAPRIVGIWAQFNDTTAELRILLSEPAAAIQRDGLFVSWMLLNGQTQIRTLSQASVDIDPTLTTVTAVVSRPSPDATATAVTFQEGSVQDLAGNGITASTVAVSPEPAPRTSDSLAATRASDGDGSSTLPVVLGVIGGVAALALVAMAVRRYRANKKHDKVLQTTGDDMAWDATIHRSDADADSFAAPRSPIGFKDTPAQL
jgi:hypothetical protein